MRQSFLLSALLGSGLLCTGNAVPAAAPAATATGQTVDCSAAYGGSHATCHPVPCDGPYAEFAGAWRGPFMAYVREKSAPDKPVYRPYQNEVRYDGCLVNSENGDFLAIGHRHDTFPAYQGLPAKEESGLIVIGHRADGTPFLRAINHAGHVDEFALTYRNTAAGFTIWTREVPAAAEHPAMTITTIDGRDPASENPSRRDVVVTLAVGPPNHPMWSGVIARGTHTRS